MRTLHIGAIVLLCLALAIDAQWFGSSKKKQEEDPNVALLSYAPVDPSVTPPSSTVAAPTPSTTPIPSTTTKKGFFGKLFGGGSKKEDKVSTTTTTTTTTTTVATPTTKKTGFFGGLFGKKDKTSTTTVAPSTTSKAGTTVKPGTVTTTAKSSSAPTVTTAKSALPMAAGPTTTSKPGLTLSTGAAAVSTTTTTSTTPKSKDAFPALPSSRGGSPTPASVPTSTVANAWTRTPPTVQPGAGGKPGVSFVPTTPGTPGAKVSSTPASASAVGDGPATDEELMALSELLFTKDSNSPSKFVTINYQKQTSSFVNTDEAPNPFLTVDETKIYAIPTIEKMHALFNNYELDTMTNEYVTPLEKKEENDFVDALLATNVMRQAMLFLQKKGIVTADPKTHHELLKTVWFTLYSRGNGKIGSSGFEHVFLNEVSNGTMIGLHNWLYVYDMEKAGRIDYKGWNKKMELGTKGEIAKVRLTFDNLQKPSNSLFVGTSPELEFALYTVCFQIRPDKECPLAVGGKPFTIKTFTFRYRGKNLIGGAWPNI